MNILFISPHFPWHFYHFCDRLKRLGAQVLGVGDAPYDSLSPEVRQALTEYYYVPSLERYDDVMRAAAFYIHKYGRLDYIESQNEYWLELEARLRTDFNVTSGWKTDQMEAVKLKSRMKEGYRRAGVPTARWSWVENLDQLRNFAREVGFPIIVKPDNGVGAGNTWKLHTEEELADKYRDVIGTYPARHFVAEEFVPGHIETYDGIADGEGQVVFCASQVMRVTPLDMLQGAGENVSYTQHVEQTDLAVIGPRVVQAFGVKNRFFHFEFFRLDEDKEGLGRKGDVIGLEVNMRAPGGYIPDKMNYAYQVDVYQIWAETLVLGGNRSFAGAHFCRYVTHFGRSAHKKYLHTPEEVRRWLGDRLLLEKVPPVSLSGGMGAQIFLAWSHTQEEIDRQAAYLLE